MLVRLHILFLAPSQRVEGRKGIILIVPQIVSNVRKTSSLHPCPDSTTQNSNNPDGTAWGSNPYYYDTIQLAALDGTDVGSEGALHYLVARGQSGDMVRGNYFADHSLTGRTPLERIVPALEPARVARSGQNIGCGSGEASTAAGMVRAWMHSPPHRRIILTAVYTQAGVGVAPSLPAVLGLGTSGGTYTLDVTALA